MFIVQPTLEHAPVSTPFLCKGVMIMKRFFVLSAIMLLALQASPAFGQVSSITITGQLSGGNFVAANCTVGNNGQITGAGVLYGTNPGTNSTYKYPFTISSGFTGKGTLTLTGKMAAGPDVTLTTTVPNGPIVFSYVVNGKTYSLTGQGQVTVK